jgi:hypothetical protein
MQFSPLPSLHPSSVQIFPAAPYSQTPSVYVPLLLSETMYKIIYEQIYFPKARLYYLICSILRMWFWPVSVMLESASGTSAPQFGDESSWVPGSELFQGSNVSSFLLSDVGYFRVPPGVLIPQAGDHWFMALPTGRGIPPMNFIPLTTPQNERKQTPWPLVYKLAIPTKWPSLVKNKQTNKQTPWPLVRERTIPTERPPLVDEI